MGQAWSAELKVMLLGRMIYGVGAESILVVNNKVLARWFKGKELAFAYGMNLTIMRLGTFLALNIQAPAAGWFGLRGVAVVRRARSWASASRPTSSTSRWSAWRAAGMGAPGVTAEGGGVAPEEKFVLKEAFSFDASFWFITAALRDVLLGGLPVPVVRPGHPGAEVRLLGRRGRPRAPPR